MTLEDNGFGPPHRVVEAAEWHDAVAQLKRDGYTYFDWLSAVDEHPEGFRLVLHVARVPSTSSGGGGLDHLLMVTYLDRDAAAVASIADVYAGASWHERETHEMFGIDFGLELEPLLLPDGFEGHPLRKEFVLASRVAKPWPGAKEPGESDAESTHSPGRRRIKPPGVPDPEDWGPGKTSRTEGDADA
ncbi:NADH-quinone oxidoreductase subunit C [Aeromicrobium ginsengisoli]|uniref:NADH-quinone oxidoreductase subunit C n=1 Tax=Aeromicrobium ginsengisoli TaxID=363867 RepID=A0A5M4FDD3_9ACTN|nr:NADH-quinone oxidoreductase subunit C [Aeromicrobium ginsengisoli]KAA1397228.1 NADH-quinone oxidoreductase subunit C [Aeromicrobium ginsengisoli]